MDKNKIESFYNYYTKNISPDNMAISLKLAFFMYELCNKYKFMTVMDRGSGFSSFILRLYAKEQDFPVTVYSVDSSSEWIEKTRSYLEQNNLSTKNLYVWNDFYGLFKGKIKFDFILEDAKSGLRRKTPNELTSFLSKNGVMLWDDYHTKCHKIIIKKQCVRLNMEIVDIQEETLDSYGRFGALTTCRNMKNHK
jgi:protein-L-isoaspartate O-methyltransferase